MKKGNWQAIYPKKRVKTTLVDSQVEKYPYLLKGLNINQPNMVWFADITYLNVHKGMMYLFSDASLCNNRLV